MLCHRFQVFKSTVNRLLQSPKGLFRAFSAVANVEDDKDYFRAAVLHPGNKALVVEKMTDRTTILEDRQLRIGIDYCAVTYADFKCMTELLNVTLPYIPGSEFGGQVLEVGPDPTLAFKPGDNVVVLSDEIHTGGGLSQHCLVDASVCVRVPENIAVEDAVTFLRSYGNAQLAFTKYCPLKENDEIIVIAGPGGNGLAAIDVATNIYKANVTVVFDCKDVRALIRDDVAYRASNAQAGLTKVYTFLDGVFKTKKAKAVFDTTTSGAIHVAADFVEPNGHFITDNIFFTAENCTRPYFKRIKRTKGKTPKSERVAKDAKDAKNAIEVPERAAWIENVKVVDFAKYRGDPLLFNQIANDVFNMFATKKINPFVSAKYSLVSEVNKAMQYISRKKCLGKVLVETKRN